MTAVYVILGTLVRAIQEVAAHSNLTLNYKTRVLFFSQGAVNSIYFLTGKRLKQVTQAK